ncbi:acyltransferase family protein [Fulvivirga ligni]|uniref:acyltransferase family protein n=1 Tax=Fulvivirga ligni TaxID=2904246 RepID=UPI001F3CFF0C|nr:acyltransferase family protein [Fulvivirga ligni]UII19750.1 acyltransferase family protein [Fulvivirga ligni]
MDNRRLDIDWLRVIAIGLLLIYHVAIGFQPWGIMIGFITSKESWQALWVPMSLLNVWRIPLLFFVSGMGVYFALRKRDWKQLIGERTLRIFVPFLFGALCLVPIHWYIWQNYYGYTVSYNPNPGHLWFLANIFIYVLVLSPLFIYIKNNAESAIVSIIKKGFSSIIGVLVMMLTFIVEVLLVQPSPFELYAMTWHGFFLGFLAFFFGFCFVLAGTPFLQMISKWKWAFLALAIALFVYRLPKIAGMNYLLSIESNLWVLALLAFGNKYLNKDIPALKYLGQAAYPVYILHMIFLYMASNIIFPLEINIVVKFFMVLIFTFAGCFLSFEVIRRVNLLRPLFGMKMKKREEPRLVQSVE